MDFNVAGFSTSHHKQTHNKTQQQNRNFLVLNIVFMIVLVLVLNCVLMMVPFLLLNFVLMIVL